MGGRVVAARPLPLAVANLRKRLADRYGSETFTTTEAAQGDVQITGRSKMGDHLRTLFDAGAVELVEPGRGPKPNTWKVVADLPENAAGWLPALDALEIDQCLTA